MKDREQNLACNDCEGIVCADTEGGRLMTQIDKVEDGRWIIFPENVADCPRRQKPENVMGWHVPEGRPDLIMPVKDEKQDRPPNKI